ncbi:MAG: hypothetical protein ACAI38_23025 [Myxococcota bacterium]|nr:hypothetical protein [Myxococcota bacterium]
MHDVRSTSAIRTHAATVEPATTPLAAQVPATPADTYARSRASEPLALGLVMGLSAGMALTAALVAAGLNAGAPMETVQLAKASGVLMFGSVAAGGLIGGAVAALNYAAAGVATCVKRAWHR